MVRFSNGIQTSVGPNHSKTGQKCSVFKWLTITQTSVDPNHSKTGQKNTGIQMNPVFGCPVFRWLLKSVFYPFPGSLRLGSQMNRLIQVTGQMLIFLITLSLGITFFYNLKPNSPGATSFWVPTSIWESLLNAGENHRPE